MSALLTCLCQLLLALPLRAYFFHPVLPCSIPQEWSSHWRSLSLCPGRSARRAASCPLAGSNGIQVTSSGTAERDIPGLKFFQSTEFSIQIASSRSRDGVAKQQELSPGSHKSQDQGDPGLTWPQGIPAAQIPNGSCPELSRGKLKPWGRICIS